MISSDAYRDLGGTVQFQRNLDIVLFTKQAGQEKGHMAGIELTHTNKIVDHCGRVRLDDSVQITTHHQHRIKDE
jgi:hypothetical protein